LARRFTKEFKTQACELVLKSGIKHSVVADKLGINVVMLYRWIDELKTYGEDAFVGKGNMKPADAELKELHKEIEILRAENEILKKAAAYFAKNRQGE
jgi:transposase